MRKDKAPKARLMLTLEGPMIRALKVRAAQEGTTASKLVTTWVRTWAAAGRRREGGGA